MTRLHKVHNGRKIFEITDEKGKVLYYQVEGSSLQHQSLEDAEEEIDNDLRPSFAPGM